VTKRISAAVTTLAAVASLVAVATLAAGCRQGLGERCQVNADCAPNICSQSEPKVCIKADDNTNDIDATVPMPDAP
jgi:hypothetical protein